MDWTVLVQAQAVSPFSLTNGTGVSTPVGTLSTHVCAVALPTTGKCWIRVQAAPKVVAATFFSTVLPGRIDGNELGARLVRQSLINSKNQKEAKKEKMVR